MNNPPLPPLTQREMSRRMGISLGKLNYCVTELARKARLTLSFLKGKVREYEEIKKQIRELSVEIEGKEGEDIFSEEVLEVLDGVS